MSIELIYQGFDSRLGRCGGQCSSRPRRIFRAGTHPPSILTDIKFEQKKYRYSRRQVKILSPQNLKVMT
jgi:hypothetical protein